MHKRLVGFEMAGRGVCDVAWRLAIPETSMEHLMQQHSGHNPLLGRCCCKPPTRDNRLFWFQAAWCTHNQYPLLVREAWSKGSQSVPVALMHVGEDLVKFNRDIFESVLRWKHEMEARLKGIQRSLKRVDSTRLFLLQKELLA